MKRRTPTLVAVYDLGAWEPRRVAEFRLTEQGAVALEVLVPGDAGSLSNGIGPVSKSSAQVPASIRQPVPISCSLCFNPSV